MGQSDRNRVIVRHTATQNEEEYEPEGKMRQERKIGVIGQSQRIYS